MADYKGFYDFPDYDTSMRDVLANMVRGFKSPENWQAVQQGVKNVANVAPSVAESLARGGIAQVPGTFGDVSQLARTVAPQSMNQVFGQRSLPTTEEILQSVPRMTPNYEGSGQHETLGEFTGPGLAKLLKADVMASKLAQNVAPNLENAANQYIGKLTGGLAPDTKTNIFIGPESKGWNKDMAFLASKLEKQGKTPEEIWQSTGTGRGLDTHWRQEISDADVPMLSYGTVKELNQYPKMQDVLGHKQVYEGYGNKIANAPVGVDTNPFTKDYYGNPQVGGASFNRRTNEYTVSPRPEGATSPDYGKAQKSGLLHEMQHGIQEQEDWARGGTPNYFNQQKDAEQARDILSFRRELATDTYKGLNDQQKQQKIMQVYKDAGISDWLPSQETMNLAFDISGNPNKELEALANLYGLNKHTSARSPQKMYENLAGEAESRLTQTRMDLTPEQRKQFYPFKEGKKQYGLDINPEDAIILIEGSDIITRKQLLEQLLNTKK